MGLDFVVVDQPIIGDFPDLANGLEQARAEDFLPIRLVEVLDERIFGSVSPARCSAARCLAPDPNR